MYLMELTPLSILMGIVFVILTASVRFHYPFRYQYYCYLFRKHPSMVKKILARSFIKNKTAIGFLDKATHEFLEGAYDEAEKYLMEGIKKVIHLRGVRNRLIRTFFYNYFSWLLYYRGQYKESLDLALQLYEKAPSTPNILALISCNFARLGEIGRAIEVMSRVTNLKKINPTILLSCQAEIEAAKGNLNQALQLLDRAKEKKTYHSIYFIHHEVDKRIGQLKKTA